MDILLAHDLEAYLKLLIAMALGVLLGLERTYAGKTAGMRTYGLVSMGSCLFIVVGAAVSGAADPLRMAAGIITGIGFLGAGLIIFKESKLSGLTTAAGLWVAAGIGIAVGFNRLMLAFFTTLLTLFTFTVLWFIEDWIKKYSKRDDENDTI